MRFARKLILIFLCLALLCVPVSALSGAQSARTDAVVSSDGSCRITMRFQLHLEQEGRLEIPLPAGAQDVRLDGKYKTPTQQEQQLALILPKMAAGIHTVEISYTLPNAVQQQNSALVLQVPLLTGFAYPVEQFEFSIVLPMEPNAQPSFSSGYYGEGILSSLNIQQQGSAIHGSCHSTLKDHETLTMTLRADEQMFPDYSPQQPLLGIWELIMVILAGAAMVYYLVALLPIIPRKIRSFSPPEGLAAGDLGTCLTGCGMDLTMMVFSWAQMGYLSIETDRQGNVTLQKRMEMGSERPALEIRCFEVLFGQSRSVDGLGLHYARLCRKMTTKSHLLRQIYRSRSGNPRIVRLLAVAVGGCSGVLLSRGVYSAGAGTVLLAIAMSLVCMLLSWGIHSGSKCLPLGNKLPIWLGMGCSAVWIGLGFVMNNLMLAALMVAYENLTGIAAALGGRRSEQGQQYVAQIRGLRSHLTRASVFDMQQCLERNPAYFFELMPYALALGVERPFARRFGKVTVAECSYLNAPVRGELTPAQWASLLRQVADRLNRRQRKLRFEQFFQQTENTVKTK
ncbi:MAG: DUF2207 domain-containing protein [Oscillospiraceae bacterium]|nr:DUF2207 domain-containing protein [Oscillospiraceae bacterium]